MLKRDPSSPALLLLGLCFLLGPSAGPAVGAAAAPEPPPAPGPPPTLTGDDEGTDRPESPELTPAAAELKFRFDGKKVTGSKVAARLTPPMATLLNEWAELADELDLEVFVDVEGHHLILGAAKEKLLKAADALMSQTRELVEPLVPVAPGREPRPVVALVFDAKGFHSEAWEGVVDALGEKQLLLEEGVEHMRRHPTGLIMRSVPLFIQPTMDMAGDATQGDDEFRYENEVANKTAQCLVSQRAGPLPANLEWGFGLFTEQRLFGTSYMFNVTGFVSASDHFDWPNRATRLLEALDEVPLIDFAMDASTPGSAEPSQVLTWALIEHFSHARPEALRELLSELAVNHKRRDSYGLSQRYEGSRRGTEAAWQTALASLDTADLLKTLKTAKSRRP